MKKCTRCHIVKTFDEYSKGYTFCKACKRKEYHSNSKYKLAQNINRKIKYAEDEVYRELIKCRSLLKEAWNYPHRKNLTFLKLVCMDSMQQFVKYIQSKFKKGMNMNNYGKQKHNWQFDHIIPLSSAKTVEEVKKLMHYKNTQPLWRDENNHKRNKI
jgi:hypothetical protein